MGILISSYIFVLGVIFGSFALAMVDRMRAGKDWVKGRSECEYCKHVLRPIDLIPIASWLSQRGKCRYCHKKLSKAYPLTEVGLGLAFLGSYIFYPYNNTTASLVMFGLWLVVLVIGCALFVFDVRWYLLPNKLVYPLIGVAFVHKLVFLTGADDVIHQLYLTAGSVFVSAGFFLLLYILSSGKWIGDGDIRLGVAIGLLLGGPAEAWFAIFIASLAGVIIALPKVLKDRKTVKMKLPFGPMLLLGLYVSYLFGSSIIDWYSRTFLFFG